MDGARMDGVQQNNYQKAQGAAAPYGASAPYGSGANYGMEPTRQGVAPPPYGAVPTSYGAPPLRTPAAPTGANRVTQEMANEMTAEMDQQQGTTAEKVGVCALVVQGCVRSHVHTSVTEARCTARQQYPFCMLTPTLHPVQTQDPFSFGVSS